MQTRALKRILATQAIDPSTLRTITKVGFGEGENPPQPTDTGLTNAYMKKISSAAVDPDEGSIVIKYALDYLEGNGMRITEVGIFTENETLLAREIRAAVQKDAETSIEGQMTILISGDEEE
jgi:hypothetical protein